MLKSPNYLIHCMWKLYYLPQTLPPKVGSNNNQFYFKNLRDLTYIMILLGFTLSLLLNSMFLYNFQLDQELKSNWLVSSIFPSCCCAFKIILWKLMFFGQVQLFCPQTTVCDFLGRFQVGVFVASLPFALQTWSWFCIYWKSIILPPTNLPLHKLN